MRSVLQTLVEHWDGSRWRIVPSPNPRYNGAEAVLSSVSAVSARDVWAGGWVGPSSHRTFVQSLFEHWDGNAWRIVPGPKFPPQQFTQVTGITAAASNDVWAVTLSTVGGLAMHWNGKQWVVDNPGGYYSDLLCVTHLAPNDAWAAGTLIAHWNGQYWVSVPFPLPPGSGVFAQFQGISAVSPSDIWASGFAGIPSGSGYNDVPLVEHWNGSKWSMVSVNRYDVVDAVLAIAKNDVWNVGQYSSDGLTEHWNGTRFSHVAHPRFIGAFHAIAEVTPNDLWAVGTDGKTVIEHYTVP
ncbi:MAG: hypothetical protein JO043_04435 [Candidatus Eremiobacteraeota bacterium]|nr:hypothetical protein [Candidatus Eremiobacteraeota bacterium]